MLGEIIRGDTAASAARVSAARVILERADRTPTRVEATVAAAVHAVPGAAVEQLTDAISRARERLGHDEPVLSGNGRSNSDG